MIITRKPIGSIAYCGRGPHWDDFLWAWSQLVQFTFENLEIFCDRSCQTVHVLHGAKSGQYFTRNWISEAMLGDWVLSVDTDHTFEPDLLYRMLRVFNNPQFPVDVLVGLYQYRGEPYNPVLYNWDEQAQRYQHIIHHATTEPLQIVRVDAAGCGHMMVRRRVYDRIREETGDKPFNPFDFTDAQTGQRTQWGEDFSFFERLRQLRIPVWCCPDIRSFHLRTKETTMDEFDEKLVQVLPPIKVDGGPLMQPAVPEMT